MLQLEGVVKSFGNKRAVDQVSLEVPAGQLLGVIGQSGSGKSTLLRMINRLGDPTAGRIRFGDVDVTALRGRSLRQWRARCAMIFQQFNLAGRLDVLTNVMMGRAFHMPPGRALLKLWTDKEKALGCPPWRVSTWRACPASAPTRCRAASSSASPSPAPWSEPDIILADEPIASLDPRNTQVAMAACTHHPPLRHHRDLQPAQPRPRPQILRPAGRAGGRQDGLRRRAGGAHRPCGARSLGPGIG